jgi:hypothetical protein
MNRRFKQENSQAAWRVDVAIISVTSASKNKKWRNLNLAAGRPFDVHCSPFRGLLAKNEPAERLKRGGRQTECACYQARHKLRKLFQRKRRFGNKNTSLRPKSSTP